MPQTREEILKLLNETFIQINKLHDKLRVAMVDNFDEIFEMNKTSENKKNKTGN